MQNQNVWNQQLRGKRSAFVVSIRNRSHKIKMSQLRQTYTLLTQYNQINIIQKLPGYLNMICDKIGNDPILQLELIMKSQSLISLIKQSNFEHWKLFCSLIKDLIILQPNHCKKIIVNCLQIILLKGIYFINQIPLFRVTIQQSINQILIVSNTNMQHLNDSTIQIISKYLDATLIIIQHNCQYKSPEFHQFISIIGQFVIACDHENSKLLLFMKNFFDRTMIQKFISWISYDIEKTLIEDILKILINVTYLFNQPEQMELIQPLYVFCYIRFVLISDYSIQIKKYAVVLLNNILLFNSLYIYQAFDFGLIFLIVNLAQHFVGVNEFYDEAIYIICASILNLKQSNQSQIYLKNFSQTQGLQIIFDYLNRDPVADIKLMILQTLQRLIITQKCKDQRIIKLIYQHYRRLQELIDNQNEEISNISKDLLDMININSKQIFSKFNQTRM